MLGKEYKILNRIAWVDVARGLGILLVIFGHVSKNNKLVTYISAFHMPLFFFISGYLFDKKKHKNFVPFMKKRAASLILPYFFFSFISFLFWGLAGVSALATEKFWPLVAGSFYSNSRAEMLPMLNDPLWFLTCLFVVEMVFFLFARLLKGKWLFALLYLMSVIGYLYPAAGLPPLPWGAEVAATAVVFYGAGYLLRRARRLPIRPDSSKDVAVVFVLALILFAIIPLLNINVSMNYLNFGNYLYFYLAAAAGIALTVILARWLDRWSFLAYLGRNSLAILGLHWLLLPVYLFPALAWQISLDFWQSLGYSALMLVSLLSVLPLINVFLSFVRGEDREDKAGDSRLLVHKVISRR